MLSNVNIYTLFNTMEFSLRNNQSSGPEIEKSARLEKLISSLGMTQRGFAKEIGASTANLSQIITGKRRLTGSMVWEIVRVFPNVNAEWLMDGSGPMLKSVEEKGSQQEEPDQEESDLREQVARQKQELAKMAEDLMREKKLNQDLVEVLKKISAWKDDV